MRAVFLVCAMLVSVFLAADPLPSREVTLCGEHQLFPFTDGPECMRKEWASDEVCAALTQLQQSYTNTWDRCLRQHYLLEAYRRQFRMTKKSELECLYGTGL